MISFLRRKRLPAARVITGRENLCSTPNRTVAHLQFVGTMRQCFNDVGFLPLIAAFPLSSHCVANFEGRAVFGSSIVIRGLAAWRCLEIDQYSIFILADGIFY